MSMTEIGSGSRSSGGQGKRKANVLTVQIDNDLHNSRKKPNRDMSNVRCFNCGKNGHFSRQCQAKRRQQQGKSKSGSRQQDANSDKKPADVNSSKKSSDNSQKNDKKAKKKGIRVINMIMTVKRKLESSSSSGSASIPSVPFGPSASDPDPIRKFQRSSSSSSSSVRLPGKVRTKVNAIQTLKADSEIILDSGAQITAFNGTHPSMILSSRIHRLNCRLLVVQLSFLFIS
jgi:hypothetical protein